MYLTLTRCTNEQGWHLSTQLLNSCQASHVQGWLGEGGVVQLLFGPISAHLASANDCECPSTSLTRPLQRAVAKAGALDSGSHQAGRLVSSSVCCSCL